MLTNHTGKYTQEHEYAKHEGVKLLKPHRIAPERLITRRYDWLQSFPFQQFHVLFNSLFKVLFIFPSRYLFAIGLSPLFSLRRNLPPILSCNPKQLDS